MAVLGGAAAGGSGTSDTLATTAASGASLTLNFSGTVQDVTLTANCTITFAGATNATPASMLVLLRQDGTGSRVVTWPAAVKWPSGTPPTLTTTASRIDAVTFVTNDGGTTIFGFPAATDLR